MIACGDALQQSPPVIDTAFDSYVNKFESKINKKVNVDVKFAPQEHPTVGVCITYTNGQREIEIDQIYWEGASAAHKEVLIFHEFGHCILGRDHDTSLLDGYFMPKSIMYPYIFGDKYLEQENYYLSELKSPEKDWTFLLQQR